MGALALARKAGKLKTGADACVEALSKGAPMAVVSSDISERTMRHTAEACRGELLKLPVTQHELREAIGARFVTAAVTDENFSKLIRQSVSEEA